MGIALLSVFVSVAWVVAYRAHAVVIAAQPLFLYVLCFGTAVYSLVILLSSFDEGSGWDETMLSKACMAIPWLAATGKQRLRQKDKN